MLYTIIYYLEDKLNKAIGLIPQIWFNLFLIFNKNYTYLFLIILILGTTIVLSSTSWLIAWIGLEINLLRLIPIILIKNYSNTTDSAIKYFIIQATSSSLMIFSRLFQITFERYFFSHFNSYLIFLTLLVKSAIAPFHIWFPQLAENFNWLQFFIAISWQKIAPMWLIANLNLNYWILSTLILSTIIGSLRGILINSIKQILIYSSITQSGWLLTTIFLNKIIWVVYFCIYIFIISLLVTFCAVSNLNFINKLSCKTSNPLILINFIFIIFSIAGFPPFLGFLSKIIVIQFLVIFWKNLILIKTLILATLISLFFYIKIILSLSLNPLIFKYNLFYIKSNFILFLIFNILGNLLIPIFLFLI